MNVANEMTDGSEPQEWYQEEGIESAERTEGRGDELGVQHQAGIVRDEL